MSTVIAFPASRATPPLSGRKRAGSRPELAGPRIVILPVVRIERHADAAPLPVAAPGIMASSRGDEPVRACRRPGHGAPGRRGA